MEYNQVRVGAVNVPRDFNCEVCDFCKNGHCLIFDNLRDCKKAKLKDRRFDVGDTVYTNSCRWLYRDGGGYKILKLKITKVIYQSKKTVRFVCTEEDSGAECVVLGNDGLTQDIELAKRDNEVLQKLYSQPFTKPEDYKTIKTRSVIIW